MGSLNDISSGVSRKKISFLARFVQRLQKYNYYLEEEKKNLSLNCLLAKNEKYTAQNMIVLQNLCVSAKKRIHIKVRNIVGRREFVEYIGILCKFRYVGPPFRSVN